MTRFVDIIMFIICTMENYESEIWKPPCFFCIQLTGLPQTGGAVASTSKAASKEPVAADADADLQARYVRIMYTANDLDIVDWDMVYKLGLSSIIFS